MNKLKIVFLLTVVVGAMVTGIDNMAALNKIQPHKTHKIIQCTQSYDESGLVDDGEVTETCREVLI